MQTLSLQRSSLAQSAAIYLLTFASLALLGAVLAYWTWAWLAPRPEPRAQPVAQAGGSLDAAYGLFGSAKAAGGAASAMRSAIVLLGVVAASAGQSSYAVMRLDAKQTVAVREGGEIEAGVRLVEVHADQVVVERKGGRETIALREKNDKSEKKQK